MRYSHALALLVALQTVYFAPVWLHRAVIFPHSNAHELALPADTDPYLSNRKFADESNAYIPEIKQHLHGQSSTWISTWNPYVELGRPTLQLAGLGKAYLLTAVIAVFTRDPFIFYTAFAMVTVYATGVFCFLFLRSLTLHPVACFSSAAGLSLGVFFSYWLTFAVFLSSVCWTLALLWLVNEAIDRPSFPRVAGISFAVYSLLMTGYPQFDILSGYLVAGFGIARLWQSHTTSRATLRRLAIFAAATACGAVMALPAYLDVAIAAQRSTRLAVGDDFFLGVLPRLHDGSDVIVFLAQLVDAFWSGNPIRSDHRFVFNGTSLTPFYAILLALSFTGRGWRRRWPWQLWLIGCIVATVWPAFYLFLVHHLGFHLSRMLPLGGALIPSFVLVAYVIDELLNGHWHGEAGYLAIAAVCLVVCLATWTSGAPLDPRFVWVSLFVAAGTVWFVRFPRPALVVVLTVVTVLVYGQQEILARPLSSIHQSSPLVERLKSELRDGSRYAKIGPGLETVLPSNQEALYEVRSLGSYDPLSPLRYQRLMEAFDGTPLLAGQRIHDTIEMTPVVDPDRFRYAGVSLVVSRALLDARWFAALGSQDGVNLYRLRRPPILAAQVSRFTKGDGGKTVVLNGDLTSTNALAVRPLIMMDDFRRFGLRPADRESVLFISEQHHPSWRAAANGATLATVVINDFYLGVLIPPGTAVVELSFEPFVVWSWVPQAIFGGLGAGCLIAYGARHLRARVRRTKS